MSRDEVEPWDVTVALRDVSLGLSRHCAGGTVPTPDELKEWLRYLTKAQRVQHALERVCEDLVEQGFSAEKAQALEAALAAAQGRATYSARKHRW